MPDSVPDSVPDFAPDSHPEAALLEEGDRLARFMAQRLPATLRDQARLSLIGRSLAVNLVNAFVPTVEHVTRHAGRPLHAQLTTDEWGRALVQVITPDGEEHDRLPVDDLLRDLLTVRGQWHPAVWEKVQDAVTGSEHHATRALADALRSKAVLTALQRQLQLLLR